ncbi:hypothetical protein FGF1_38010 [Flavobacteriaceae bacterium GF1]
MDKGGETAWTGIYWGTICPKTDEAGQTLKMDVRTEPVAIHLRGLTPNQFRIVHMPKVTGR